MKKILLGLATAGLIAGNAKAITLTTWDDTDHMSVTLSSIGQTTSGNLNIKVQDADGITDLVGFNPGADSLLAATVKFSFDIQGFSNPVSVDWDLNTGLFDSGSNSSSFFETQFTVGPGLVNGLILAQLDANGFINYDLTYSGGSTPVTLTSARLTAIGTKGRVPDGGSTVMLLGSTLMGMAAVARRKK